MQKQETQDQGRYWPALDGLRTLAFAFVFFHHADPANLTAIPSLNAVLQKACTWGWTGVDLFFVLSGFLISYLLLQERRAFGTVSIKNFYARRVLRIWPLYMTLLAALALVPLMYWQQLHAHLYRPLITKIIVPFLLFAGNYYILSAGDTVKNLCSSLNINWIYYNNLIGPLWSLCIEEQFYLIWPWILLWLRGPRRLWVACSALITVSFFTRLSIFLYVFSTGQGCEHFRYSSLCHIDGFMFGAMLALAEHQHPGWAKRFVCGTRGALVLSVVLGLWASTIIFAPGVRELNISIVPLSTLISASFAALILLALNWQPASRFFSNKVMVSIGRVTYAMYLLHYFVITLVNEYVPHAPNPCAACWISITAAFLTTLILARASWFLLESRMLALRKYFNRPAPPVTDEVKKVLVA